MCVCVCVCVCIYIYACVCLYISEINGNKDTGRKELGLFCYYKIPTIFMNGMVYFKMD